jgi:hypothetical protein
MQHEDKEIERLIWSAHGNSCGARNEVEDEENRLRAKWPQPEWGPVENENEWAWSRKIRDHEKNVYACMVLGGLTSGKA